MRTSRHRLAARFTSLGLLAVLAATAAGCDVGHSIVADNQTDQALYARLIGTVRTAESSGQAQPLDYVVVVPARARTVLVEMSFAGPTEIRKVEFLGPDCRLVASFPELYKGSLFVITARPSVEQREEFPAGEATAERTDACTR
jgi:hypothetical protein